MERRGNDQILLKAAAIGAVAGMRSMAAPALLARGLSEDGLGNDGGRVEKLLSSKGVTRVLSLFAGGEMLVDKAPFALNRTSPLPLVGRAVIGSLAAAALSAHRHVPVLFPAAVGATSAIASTFATYHARRLAVERFDVPDRLLGLIEDALVLGISRTLADEID
ncbi:MAG: DUF4126 domain-containing protein [Gemmatimonas sp.]|nr:DUF4126 domain-containing protein [Gemmatimonas sp.]